MPGLGMNSHSDYGRFGQDRGYTKDMRADEDLYRRPVRNGGGAAGPRPAADRFNSDLADQSSLSDFNSSEPAFELDHLATFAAGGIRQGTMHVEDGLRKLRQMENTTGIWTMRCILLVERRFLVILDKNSGEDLERFPISFIQEPTAIFKNDRREIYNNLVLFTVMDEANKRDAQADMHIFQSVRTPAQSIVDEIFAAKRGQGRISNSGEAVLSEIFRNLSINIEGRDLHQQNINRASTFMTGTRDHNAIYSAADHAGFRHTFQQNTDTRSAATDQNVLEAPVHQSGPSTGYRDQSERLGKEVQVHQSGLSTGYRDQSEHWGKEASVHQSGLNTGYRDQPEHWGKEAPVHQSGPSSGYRDQSEHWGKEASVHQSGPSSGYRDQSEQWGKGSSEVHQIQTASGMQRQTRVVTRHTTTHQTGGDVEVVRITANPHTEGSPDQNALGRQGYKIPPPPAGPAPEAPGPRGDPYDFGGFQETIEQRRYNQFDSTQYGASQFNNGGGFLGGAQRTSMMARPTYSPFREREDELGSNELLERDVQLLNHCFDDIEKFVARLQQAAEAYKELEKRKRERGGKGKKNTSGDGMLGHRARPPPAQDFVDIFQKFKLSFNLLAKLKAHIHDPNAPELVHFLFTPLSLIYEASRDPIHGSVNLGEQAAAPVLTQDAKQLLLNCLTSKEIELWQALGKNWTTSKDEWKGYIPPYVPRFYDGWQPAPTVVEEPVSRSNLESAVAAHHNQILNRQHEQDVREYVRDRVMPFPPEEERFSRERASDFPRYDSNMRAPSPPRDAMSNPTVVGYQQYVEQHIDRNYRANHPRGPEPASYAPPPVSQPPVNEEPVDENTAYLEELKKTGAAIFVVLHDRNGQNAKEATVKKGEYLQVLDRSRNWWKVRNSKGQTGYCPYTILKEVSSGEDKDGVGTTQPVTAAPTLPDRKGSNSKRGDTKYF